MYFIKQTKKNFLKIPSNKNTTTQLFKKINIPTPPRKNAVQVRPESNERTPQPKVSGPAQACAYHVILSEIKRDMSPKSK